MKFHTTGRAAGLRGLLQSPTVACATVSPSEASEAPAAGYTTCIHRLLKALTVTVAVLALTACSMLRMTYNNADTLLRYMAWDYFDLDAAQSEQMKLAVSRLHQWHRASELPDYAALATEASRRIGRGVTNEDVLWAIASLRSRTRRATARAAEEAAPILVTLAPAQIETLERRFAEKNRKYAREYLADDKGRRARAQSERTLEHFHDYLGDLSAEQQSQVERFVLEHARYAELRFEERQRWQREAVALIRRHRIAEELGVRLSDLLVHPEARRGGEYAIEERRWDNDLATLLADFNRTLSSKQREHAVKRLKSFAEDFGALAGAERS